MVAKLEDIDIRETSGVDHPATLTEGWMVMKSANLEADIEEILAAAEEYEKAAGDLMRALESNVQFLQDAPDEVKAAVNTLHSYLKGLPAEQAPAAAAPAQAAKDVGDGNTGIGLGADHPSANP